jgi:molybdopterin-binding protein
MSDNADNRLPCVVRRIDLHPGSADLIVELPGGPRITARMSKETLDRLGLSVGETAYAVIPAWVVQVGF